MAERNLEMTSIHIFFIKFCLSVCLSVAAIPLRGNWHEWSVFESGGVQRSIINDISGQYFHQNIYLAKFDVGAQKPRGNGFLRWCDVARSPSATCFRI